MKSTCLDSLASTLAASGQLASAEVAKTMNWWLALHHSGLLVLQLHVLHVPRTARLQLAPLAVAASVQLVHRHVHNPARQPMLYISGRDMPVGIKTQLVLVEPKQSTHAEG